MIVPVVPGGIADTLGRILSERMRKSLGQRVIIENISGADGSIAAGRSARAKPDGYTIDLGYQGNHVLNGAAYSLQYDVLKDFAPISLLASTPNILFAKRTIPATDVNELIAWLKGNTNRVSIGVTNVGRRILAAFLQKEAETQLILVPYRGGAPARQDLVASRIDLLFDTLDALPLMRAGSTKAYAVTSETRSPLAPDIPTFREVGFPGLTSSGWLGFFAPKATPTDVIGRLNAAVIDTLADQEVRSRLIELGLEVFRANARRQKLLARS
jgi:tripartite-type tricarboxylate transporter receptor subunit TctC